MTTELILHELIHGLVAIPGAFYLWMKTRNLTNVLLVFILTFLIDIDHLADYFVYYGLTFKPVDFLALDYFINGKALVPFHGWEYLLILLFVNTKKSDTSLNRIMLFSYLPHIVLDTINVGSVAFYSLAYRLFIYIT